MITCKCFSRNLWTHKTNGRYWSLKFPQASKKLCWLLSKMMSIYICMYVCMYVFMYSTNKVKACLIIITCIYMYGTNKVKACLVIITCAWQVGNFAICIGKPCLWFYLVVLKAYCGVLPISELCWIQLYITNLEFVQSRWGFLAAVWFVLWDLNKSLLQNLNWNPIWKELYWSTGQCPKQQAQ